MVKPWLDTLLIKKVLMIGSNSFYDRPLARICIRKLKALKKVEIFFMWLNIDLF